MRRAKIVCTLGPATSSAENLRELVTAGMDVARLNLSHGTHADHDLVYRDVRAASDAAGRAVGVLVDLQGPKIRTARFADGPVQLVKGATFTITTRDVPGDVHEVGTTYSGLPGDVHSGDRILIDDGKLALIATEVTETDVVCQVLEGGPLSNNKGINLPGVAVSVPALSEKDEDDLRWGLRIGADMIALSFVRSADDIRRVHEIMDEEGLRLPVIAKIEKPQAVENLDEIIRAFDGVMVARGDLGVEMPLEQVPLVQKRACEIARRRAKPVIVATQVLESMIENSRPTRAEASDAANAVLDGADALMLSGETSVGKHAFAAVRTMARIIENTETHGLHRIRPLGTRPNSKGGAVTAAAAEIGELLGRQVPHHLHRGRRLLAAPGPGPPPHPDARVHPEPGHPQPARAHLGDRDLPRGQGPAHRRDGHAGRRGAPRARPGHRGRRRHHRRRARRPGSRARPTPFACTGSATRRTGWPRPTSTPPSLGQA